MDMKEWMETRFIKGLMEDRESFIDEHPDFSLHVFDKMLEFYNTKPHGWWINPEEFKVEMVRAFEWDAAQNLVKCPQLFRAFHYWSTQEDPRITLDELYVFDAPHFGIHKVRVA